MFEKLTLETLRDFNLLRTNLCLGVPELAFGKWTISILGSEPKCIWFYVERRHPEAFSYRTLAGEYAENGKGSGHMAGHHINTQREIIHHTLPVGLPDFLSVFCPDTLMAGQWLPASRTGDYIMYQALSSSRNDIWWAGFCSQLLKF